jgi:uncharacterized membrane protein (DUF4010 family)
VAGLLVLSVPMVLAYADDVRHGRDRGMTSEVAFVVTYLLGVLGFSPQVLPESRHLIVAGLGVAVTALLSTKEALHGWVTRISKEDLYATVKFLVVAVIVLPLLPEVLPEKTWEPLQALKPRQIGILITFIAGISFAGYVGFRLFGAGRGMALTGLLGGLVSSTAVTLSLSGRAKEHPSLAPACAAGLVLAWTVMFVRVLIVVAVVHLDLAKSLAAPMLGAAAVGLVASFLSYRGVKERTTGGGEVKLSNPFSLWSAVKFGGLFAAILVVSKLAVTQWSGAGLLVIAAVAGATDVDAIVLTAAKMGGESQDLFQTAALAVLIACATNTVVKGGMAWVVGGAEFGKKLLPVIGTIFGAGAAGVALGMI